jgi:hypothetical protein
MEYRLFVVTPFFGTAGKIWSEAILPAVQRVNSLQDFKVNPQRADFSLKGLEFRQNLHTHLDEADLCICDITGANPNVMYEIGYARAKQKKTILIRQAEQEIPVDLQDKYVQTYDAASLVDLSLYLETAVVKGIEAIKTKRASTQPSYDVRCFKDRDASDLGHAIAEASDHIEILETNVSTVVNAYIPQLKKALDRNPTLSVRVLTLNPDSSFVNNRAAQLGVPIGQYREELHDSIRRLLLQLEKYGERITLRIYDDFPTQITFMVDDEIYSCSIARSNRSRRLCTFKLHGYDQGAERTFQFHFEAVWGFGEVYVPHGHTIVE